MADLAFTVDYKQLKAANAELERTGKVSKTSAQAYEFAFSQVVKWQQKFSTEQSKVSAKLEETYRNQNLANKSARDSARAFEEAERATKRLAQTKEELSRKYKPLYAQSKLYERSLEEINQANKLGVLTDKQRQVSIQELNQAFTTGTGVFSKYASEASRRTNQMGVVTQQVGYQVGDFLVQVQSGTNVMVAFGQQATQLVGVLPLMGAGFMGLSQVALVGLSAGLGIAIPLVTAIGAAFLRTRESTNSAKDAISELDSALKSLDSTLKNWVQSKKAAAAGVTVEELLGTTGLEQAETNLANAKSKLELARALERSTGGVGVVGAAATAYNFFAGGSVEQLEEEVRKAEERIKTLKKKNLDEEKADRNENVADMIQVFRDAQKRMREEDEETRRLREENQLSMIEVFRAAQKRMREEEEKSRSEREANILSMVEVFRNAQKRMREEEEKSRSEREANILSMIEVFRAAQKRMRDEQAATDAEIAKGYANSLGFSKQLTNETDAYVKSAAEGFRQTEKLKEQLGNSAYEALRLAGVDMTSGISSAAKEAANLAASLGISLTAAVNLQNLRGSKTYSGRGGDPREVNDYTSELGYKTVDEVVASLTKTKGSKKAPKDPLVELNKRITLDEKLLGVSKERETVLRAIANSDKEYSDAAINGAISRLEAYNKEKELLEEAAAQQQNIADTLKNSMEDAFMSIVDGTKSAEDAFKDMARMIISELYKVLVVQQMVGSFEAGGGGILGSIFGAIGKKASGGTVMSNQPYLVGEKGPEVIVPQNRGHVMNADLTAKAMGGSGEAVVVNQTFNFAANGDDSVKKLIAQAAPQIANMTQKQIMDSRRRGGALKSTFG